MKGFADCDSCHWLRKSVGCDIWAGCEGCAGCDKCAGASCPGCGKCTGCERGASCGRCDRWEICAFCRSFLLLVGVVLFGGVLQRVEIVLVVDVLLVLGDFPIVTVVLVVDVVLAVLLVMILPFVGIGLVVGVLLV